MLIGVAGFLENPTEIGVETLAVTMFGMGRCGSIEDRRVGESSTSCRSKARDKAGVSNRCVMEEGGCIVFGVSLKCTGAVLEEPGFKGEAEADRRCFATGRNIVPPFSVREQLNTQ